MMRASKELYVLRINPPDSKVLFGEKEVLTDAVSWQKVEPSGNGPSARF
jgi:hypothetical protein